MNGNIPLFKFSKLKNGIHRIAIVGPSESGKTSLSFRIIEDAFLERTDIFLVYAQNESTLRDWRAFFEYHNKSENLITISQSSNDENLKNAISRVEISQAKLVKQGKKPLKYLLILDDFIGSMRGTSLNKKRTIMNNFSYQSRHNNMSVFFLLQDIIALDARSFSSNTCNIIMKDESHCNMENHYESKILGPTADGLFGGYKTKSGRVSLFCRLMRNLGAYEALCAFKNRKTQRISLYLIPNTEN